MLRKKVSEKTSEEVLGMANEYLENNNEDTAIVLYSIVFSRYQNGGDEKSRLLCAETCKKMADIYFDHGNYAAALDYLIRGIETVSTCKDKSLMAQFYLRLGNVYCVFQDYEKGINCYQKGYDLCKEDKDLNCKYSLVKNLTGAYNYIGDIQSAQKYYDLSLKFTPADDHMKIYLNMLNKGLIEANDGAFNEAAEILKKSAEYAVLHHLNPRSECSSYEELYRLYQKKGLTDSTLFFLDKCDALARKHDLTDIIVQNLKSYSEVYENIDDKHRSLDYKSRFLAMSDSIFNQREFNRIKNQQYFFEVGQYEKEISMLNLRQEKDRLQIKLQRQALIVSLTGITMLAVFLLILYIQKKKLSVAYRNIFNVNSEIIASEKYYKKQVAQYEEKLKLMAGSLEMSNNITAVKSYVNNAASKEKKQELLEAIDRIMTTTEEFFQPDFSLDKLASLVGSNNTYVSQVINETYKKNFSTFLNEYRIKEARVRLADLEKYGHYTIRAIYESVGYRSNSAFINSFKNIVGITPSTFKNMVKEEYERQRKISE